MDQSTVERGNISLIFRPLKDPASHPRYDGSESSSQVLPTAFKRRPECRAFQVPTVYEKDIQVVMRDGTILKGDIFRPDVSEPVPAIVPWSPYGKSGRGTLSRKRVDSQTY